MGMEDDTRGFLVLIANTIAWVLLWMIANVLIGIYWGYGFYEFHVGWKNIVYYIFAVVSFILLARHIIHKWKGWF